MRRLELVADTHVWRLIQSWMDGQLVRMNQSQLADALGVGRQSLSQWKAGSAPSPKHLRAIRRVTRLDWGLLTDALLRDLGYTEEDPDDGTATSRAGVRPAHEDPGMPYDLAAKRAEREVPPSSQE